jgi:hypothetical protein
MENNFDAPFHKATYVGETTEAFTNGGEYYIHIQKMLDNRYQVFKSLHHFREPHTGHKVYNSIEQIKTNFIYAD